MKSWRSVTLDVPDEKEECRVLSQTNAFQIPGILGQPACHSKWTMSEKLHQNGQATRPDGYLRTKPGICVSKVMPLLGFFMEAISCLLEVLQYL